jgi:hypothetical protein
MGNKILVDEYELNGKKLIDALKENKFPLSGAFWEFDQEIEDWYLMIVTKLVEEKGPIATYSKIDEIIKKYDIHIRLDSIKVIKPKDKRALVIKGIIQASSNSLADIKISGSGFNSIYFEDLYIYNL